MTQEVQVPVPMQQEEVVVPKVIPSACIQHQLVKHEVQVPVPATQEEIGSVPKVIRSTRIQYQQEEQEDNLSDYALNALLFGASLEGFVAEQGHLITSGTFAILRDRMPDRKCLFPGR